MDDLEYSKNKKYFSVEDILLREVLMDLMDLKETLIQFRKCQQGEKILGNECKKSRIPKI